MNKKVVVSLAASLTLFASPFVNKTEAAEISKPTVKVQCQTGQVVIPKEVAQQFAKGNVDWQSILKQYGWTVQQPAQQAPTTKPAPEAKPAPTTKPAPEAKPAPTTKPAPEAKPAPTTKPAPEAKPAPTTKPAPEAKPAPTTKPAPEAKPAPTTKPAPSKPSQTTAGLSAFEQQVVDLTNQERQKAGLQPLKADTQLSSVARKKSEDMLAKNYFSHTSPTYGSPFDMMKQFGITYRTAGENIAKGQRTPAEVVKAWMESPGHRANILNKDYTHIGVGYVENGNIWTQMFIGK
ncbi:hypothetical protein AC623_11900 [Bacillus sp. FJAT-27231]|uniref:CAP domain-containing protein n=1 Tax=Bacillus sp. FJAT-27231 TaxID=1679168 RepID=UPI0006A07A84|nr:CAP domain-containing protein [Bacillus sp. FJAT-27231]KMY54531.1 hypothetical protein AC623_11900 [Bacillus sp. FJAT-27231]